MKTIEEEILNVLSYFDLFNYPPTVEEIYTFFKKKTLSGQITSILERMAKKGIIIRVKSSRNNLGRYTPGKYHKNNIKDQKSNIKNFQIRENISVEKREKVKLYIKLLSFFPQIKLIGLSGTVAMMNARDDDDIDLFIITAKNRLFTGRFIALFIAQVLGIRRSKKSLVRVFEKPANARNLRLYPYLSNAKWPFSNPHTSTFLTESTLKFRDKVCLNLFFDEKNLTVPDFKKTEYVAHEILQMKPLLDRENVYNRFLRANSWVYEIFPNALKKQEERNKKKEEKVINRRISFSNSLETLLKKIELIFINRHRTSEIITDSQLWFHPDDFEKKIGLISKNRQ